MSEDMPIQRPSVAGDNLSLRSMQEVAMNDRNASKMLRTYNVAYWGNNYFDVNELGHISVCPDPDVPHARVDLAELVKERQKMDSACQPCSASRRSCSIACVPLTPRSNVRVNPSAMKVATSWFTRSRLTSTVA